MGRCVLVLSETVLVLVLVIESSLSRSYVRSTHALPITEKNGSCNPGTITSRSTSTRVGRCVLVLSETVLVLVIESSLKRSNVLSTHDLPLTEAKLVPLSEHDNEYGERAR